MNKNELHDFLNQKYIQYSTAAFISDDPIQIPHHYSAKQDIEIAGLFAAIFSWGQRKTIINKSNDLLARMDDAPFEFVKHAAPIDLKALDGFAHRTFNAEDVRGFVQALQKFYAGNDSLETLFIHADDAIDLKNGLHQFKQFFVDNGIKKRTERHLPDPFSNSAAKRVNMYLRWMVRKDAVDFGIWPNISPSLLSCPLDVHSGRVARSLGLLKRTQNDWRAVEELNISLRKMDAADPVKYDFALFGLGVFEGFK
jgi:uncharacterized protein (TIGR02757 family)